MPSLRLLILESKFNLYLRNSEKIMFKAFIEDNQ